MFLDVENVLEKDSHKILNFRSPLTELDGYPAPTPLDWPPQNDLVSRKANSMLKEDPGGLRNNSLMSGAREQPSALESILTIGHIFRLRRLIHVKL